MPLVEGGGSERGFRRKPRSCGVRFENCDRNRRLLSSISSICHSNLVLLKSGACRIISATDTLQSPATADPCDVLDRISLGTPVISGFPETCEHSLFRIWNDRGRLETMSTVPLTLDLFDSVAGGADNRLDPRAVIF